MKWLFLFLLLVGCTSSVLTFELDERPVNGEVYVNGNFIGETAQGSIVLEEKKQGEVTIVGTQFGRGFNFTYQLTEKMRQRFILPSDYFETYTLSFETVSGDAMNGEVYLDDEYLGRARGELAVPLEELYAGRISFTGTYTGEDFEFFFTIPKDFRQRPALRFVINEDALANLAFDTSFLNERKVAELVFEEVNKRRLKDDVAWHTTVYSVAQDYASFLPESGFSHEDILGRNVGERLQEEEIVYIVSGENLYFADNLDKDITEEELAAMTIDGWMNSPGHRSLVLDRDGLYTHGAVGVHCEVKACYVVLNIVGLERNIETTLQANSCWFISLYDASYPFEYDARVTVDMEADDTVTMYLVDDKDEIDACVQRDTIDYQEKYVDDDVEETFRVEKGEGLLFETTSDVDIDLRLTYR